MRGYICQDIVDYTEKSGQNIVRGPHRQDDKEAGNEIFFKKTPDFFHVCNITDFNALLQAFFEKVRKESEQ